MIHSATILNLVSILCQEIDSLHLDLHSTNSYNFVGPVSKDPKVFQNVIQARLLHIFCWNSFSMYLSQRK
jgi:hypothetical protein